MLNVFGECSCLIVVVCVRHYVKLWRRMLRRNDTVTACQKDPVSCLKVSRLMGKPTICICENKDADQLRGNREADQRLCFRYTDNTLPLLFKSEISSFQPASVTVQPDLCRTCSETTLLVFLRGGSSVVMFAIMFPKYVTRLHFYDYLVLTQHTIITGLDTNLSLTCKYN